MWVMTCLGGTEAFTATVKLPRPCKIVLAVLCALSIGYSLAAGELDLERGKEAEGDELESDLREPALLLYIPFDGTSDGYGPRWTDRSLARAGYAPLPYSFADGVVGQARAKGPYGYAGVCYPIAGNIKLEEGTLLLWFRWDKGTEKGPLGSFISADLFPLSIGHDVFRPIRQDEKWHHVAIAWERGKKLGQVYLDGKEVLRLEIPPKWVRVPARDENNKPLPITHDMLIADQLPGRVDEVYIWDAVLSPERIRAAMKRGLEGKTAVPRENLPGGKPWRPLAGLAALGDKRAPAGAGAALPEPIPAGEARFRVPLDGTWRCQPLGRTEYVPSSVLEEKELCARQEQLAEWWPVAGSWLELPVPGSWLSTPPEGREVAWYGASPAQYYGAIYERDFEAPTDWRGKGVYLRIAGPPPRHAWTVCPISVFLNDRFVGESFAGERDPIDLTETIELGRRNRLALLVGYPTLPMAGAGLGSVSLEVRASRELSLQYVFVTPLDAPPRLDLIVEIAKRVEGTLPLQLECFVWDWPDGRERRSLGKKPITLPAEGDPWQSLSFDFPDPRRWDFENPHMYNLQVRATRPDGVLLDASEPTRFGFRTVSVSGKDLLLNGKVVHIRGMSHNSPGPGEGGFAYKKLIGLNGDRCLSSYLAPARDATLAQCDEAGWLQCYHVDFSPYWRESELRAERELFWTFMRQLWNHPSVVMWFVWGNGFVNGPHGHPRQIGGIAGVDFDPKNESYVNARRYCEAFHRNAPGRPFFYYRLGVGGDVRAIMHYMGWGVPNQTREEWPSYWFEHCDEPFMLAEGSLPMFKDDYLWQWGRGFGKDFVTASNGAVEHAARYFGDEVYNMVTRDMAVTMDFADHGQAMKGLKPTTVDPAVNPDVLDTAPRGGKETEADDLDKEIMADQGTSKTGIPLATQAHTTSAYAEAEKIEGPKERWDFTFQPVNIEQTPVRWKLKSLAVRRVLCAWRTYGIGYLVHCCFKRQELLTEDGKLNPIGETVVQYNSPLLLYIGGPPEDFVLKDHGFYAGEKIVKQIIVRNDHARPVRVAASWRAIDLADKSEVAQGTAEFTVEVGALRTETISFVAPAAETKRRLRIIVSSSADGQKRRDETFDLQVHPIKPAFEPTSTQVGLIDPVGDTAAMLKKAGQPFRQIAPGGSLEGLDLLIVGRKAYTEETRRLLDGLGLRDAIARGLNLIVFEQTNRWVMGLLNEHFDNRNAFIRDRRSPLFEGLDDEDFGEWRGSSDIVAAYPDWERKADWIAGKYSKHGMGNEFGQGRFYHWSNKGMVCTFSYNKPQVGKFRILMDNAFDLLFTPLLEERIGDGRILFCQLDVTNRYGTDPTASLLVDRLLRVYAAKRPAATVRVGYLGGAEGRKLLAPLGLELKDINDPRADLAGVGLCIVSADEAAEKLEGSRDRWIEFLDAGNKLVLLPVKMETPLDWLPVQVKRQYGEAFVTRNVADGRLLDGLGPSDFFYRRCVRFVRVAADVAGAFNADSGLVSCVPAGKGSVVLCQVEPSWFEWCWQQGKAIRVWATILQNLGAASSLTLDPLCADEKQSKAVYPVPTLPFDPDAHVVW